MPFFVVVAWAFSLLFALTPNVGYAPLPVHLRARLTNVMAAPPDTELCFAWQNDAGQENSPWAEEHLSCQPVIPPWSLYQQDLLLPCGRWTIRSLVLVGDKIQQISAIQSVRVLSAAGDRHPCDDAGLHAPG